ncbi:ABC transporter permease [Alteromonas sp. ASW11-130]|uniref:ABC transporter permease n=1 Tax=Alteromonas sp. ASW11-130 TaxID=3015775 RepID=UPI0022422EDF|nr:ABC transporter permease [Alteromonas sp. ASW11-130]MCW8092492.1 ABC transporter permease [Alteromonas sp. ASW11-130]
MNFYIRTAWQSLKLRPLFALGVVTTLSITFSILLVMFNLHHVLLVKALPYSNQDSLHAAISRVYEEDKLKLHDWASYPAIEHVVKNMDKGKVAVVNYHEELATDLNGFPMLRVADTVTNYFSMLGAQFAIGKGFPLDLELNAKEPIAVISYRAWREYFAGDTNILERKVTINDVSYSIVGVTSESFVEPALFQVGAQTDIWLPWEYNTWEEGVREGWASLTDQIKMFVQTEPGQTPQQMQHQLNTLIGDKFKQETQGSPHIKNGSYSFEIKPLKDYLVGDSVGSLWFFIAGSIALAIIAIINVSNLLLARATEQQRNLAIKATLGASKKKIFNGLFIENTILTGVSGGVAVIIAYILTNEVRHLMQGMLPRLQELSLSWPTILFAITLIFSIGLLFTLMVANSLKYNKLIFSLKSSGKGSGLQVSSRVRQVLIASQLCLAAPILVATTNLAQESLEEVMKESGFEVENRYYVNLNTVMNSYPSEERVPLINEIKERLLQLPQVVRVSNSYFVPMMSNRWQSTLRLDDDGSTVDTYTNMIDEQYLPLMGIDLLQGNNFTREEILTYQSSSVIINETLARKIAPNGDVVGKYISWTPGNEFKQYLVIGVVEDIQVPNTPNASRIYLSRFNNFRFMIETKSGTELSREEFLDVVQEVSSSFYIYDYRSIESAYDSLTLNNKFIAGLSLLMCLLTIVLASMGIYGVLSYDVNLRRYELGVRMALGASPKHIANMIFGENIKLFVFGAFISVAIIFAMEYVLRTHFSLDLYVSPLMTALSYVITLATILVASSVAMKSITSRWPVHALK